MRRALACLMPTAALPAFAADPPAAAVDLGVHAGRPSEMRPEEGCPAG